MQVDFHSTLRLSCCGVLALAVANAFGATPTVQGQSGYINMPNASVETDATFSLGYAYEQASRARVEPRFLNSIEESPEVAPLLEPRR